MSRSFKQTPGFCDRNPFNKRQANKRVRKDWTLANGGAYRRRFESWDIGVAPISWTPYSATVALF